VYQIIVASDDSLWIATLDGISHIKDGHIRNYSAADGLSSNQVLSVYQDRGGAIWAQTQGGLDRLAGERFVPFSSAQPRDGPSSVRLAEDSLGDLYTADSPKGISLIQDGRLTRFNEDLQVLGMVESTEHDLWFSGRNGIIRIPLNELKRSVNDHDAPLNYALFDRSDGLNSMQCSAGAPNMAITADDKLWVATVKGLAMIDLARLPRTSRRPKVFVGAVTIGKDKVLAGQQLFLDPGAHHIELHLQAVDLASPKKIRLQYRMDGIDANWLDADASRTAIYTTIPPGTHHLHIRSTSGDGVWDRVGIVYDVTQRPYFYQRYWFYVLCIGFAMFSVWCAHRVRLRSIEARIKERTEERADERVTIARDLHDTLLQGVQGLILRFHAVARELPEVSGTRQQLNQALALADSVLVDARDRVTHLRSSVIDLAQSLAEVGSGMKFKDNIRFVVSTEGTVSPLRNAVQEELFSIGREAITNAFRHADASEIKVELVYSRTAVCLICRDDGRGLQQPVLGAGRAEGHWGMLGMRERAERIYADFECWSEPGKGTEIKVCLSASRAYARHQALWARLIGGIKRIWS